MAIVGVLLPLPFNEVFDYQADESVELGDLVRVSFGHPKSGGGEIVGAVWKKGRSSNLPENKIKPILEKLPLPPLSADLRKFVTFVADYNMAFKGLVLKMVLSVREVFGDPKMQSLYQWSGKTLAEAKLKNSDARWRVIDLVKHFPYNRQEIAKGAGVGQAMIKTLIDAGILEAVQVEVRRDFAVPDPDYGRVKLTREQQAAADVLSAKVGNGFAVTLLDGVTGSGKTEVYFEAAAEALRRGEQVLVMVPEIALTTQWLERFERRFGVKPAKWHSALGNKERAETWKAIAEGRAKVIVGARSALFLPYQKLGLVVVDESHDSSYKQEDIVNYQGRDMAVVRAKLEAFPLILATATPDLETLVNVEEGKYERVVLASRFAAARLPEIKIIDLKKDKPQKRLLAMADGKEKKEPSWLSPTLIDALRENLERGEQSMLFLNRRGYAPLVICRDCGYRIACPHCTAWLTEHKASHSLVCHHCGYTASMPKMCPDCGSEDGLTACGPGVERIAEEVRARFPEARIRLLSSDLTATTAEISEVIAATERGEVDILIGTQILAKGHHFPSLTAVGIVDADLGLLGSDLRGAERTYQLLSQVAGRAGRAEKKGTVFVQTLYPENPVLQALADHDRSRFEALEKQSRRILKMPPYGKLAALIVSGPHQSETEKVAAWLGHTAPNNDFVATLGPAPAPIFMLRNKYRYRLLLKTAKNIKIQALIREWLSKVKRPANVRITVDIDPYSFM